MRTDICIDDDSYSHALAVDPVPNERWNYGSTGQPYSGFSPNRRSIHKPVSLLLVMVAGASGGGGGGGGTAAAAAAAAAGTNRSAVPRNLFVRLCCQRSSNPKQR